MERLELWDEMKGVVDRKLCPWVVRGDFNVILNEKEKLKGLSFTQNEAIDFTSFIRSCASAKVQIVGSKGLKRSLKDLTRSWSIRIFL